MDSTTVWLRIFANGGMAAALSVITVVCGWLCMKKFIGHRRLIASVGAFCLIRSIASVYQMETGYTGRVGSPEVTALLIVSVVAGIYMALEVLRSAGDLLTTLMATESLELVRQERQADKELQQTLFRYMAQQNRDSSASVLLESSLKMKRTS